LKVSEQQTRFPARGDQKKDLTRVKLGAERVKWSERVSWNGSKRSGEVGKGRERRRQVADRKLGELARSEKDKRESEERLPKDECTAQEEQGRGERRR